MLGSKARLVCGMGVSSPDNAIVLAIVLSRAISQVFTIVVAAVSLCATCGRGFYASSKSASVSVTGKGFVLLIGVCLLLGVTNVLRAYGGGDDAKTSAGAGVLALLSARASSPLPLPCGCDTLHSL